MCPPESVVHACPAAAATPSPSSSLLELPSSSSLLERPKSAKRRAAERLLERRFSTPSLPALAAASGTGGSSPPSKRRRSSLEQQRQHQQQQQQQRPPVHVSACSDCCDNGGSGAGTRCPQSSAATPPAWCAQDVALPPMDWPSVLQAVRGEADVTLNSATQTYRLPGDILVHVVSRVEQLAAALGALRASMQDSCVAIDLEWRPEGYAGVGPTRVALMQLASAHVAVLVRISHMGFRMPPALHTFLSDPDLTYVGFAWDSSDEQKMRSTFGTGRALFARFVDLQQVGESLGYHGFGLGALTHQVLGFQPPKCRKVTMSNWEARSLSAKQVQYAALDAIITGHIFRGLRLWHASPSACTACRQMLGAVLPTPNWLCLECDRSFNNKSALMSHRQQKGHRVTPGLCQECGRVHAGPDAA